MDMGWSGSGLFSKASVLAFEDSCKRDQRNIPLGLLVSLATLLSLYIYILPWHEFRGAHVLGRRVECEVALAETFVLFSSLEMISLSQLCLIYIGDATQFVSHPLLYFS